MKAVHRIWFRAALVTALTAIGTELRADEPSPFVRQVARRLAETTLDAKLETNLELPLDGLGAGGGISTAPVVSPGHPFSTDSGMLHEGETYPHIISTDVWDESSFWYTERPNLLNQWVPENWDATKIINTDRPDFTDVATVVGKGVRQLETGYTYRRREDGFTAAQSQSSPECLLRLGISDKCEFRIKWDGYLDSRVVDSATSKSVQPSGLSDLQLGFKRELIQQNDWIPLQTIVTRLVVPTGSKSFSANTVQPGFTYIYNWQVRRWWFFRGSTGVDWLTRSGPVFKTVDRDGFLITRVTTGRDYQVQGHQSLSSYMQICRQLAFFAEWFVLFREKAADDRPDHYHDYGLYFYPTPNCQIDLRIGQRLGGRIDEFFTGGGVSARF